MKNQTRLIGVLVAVLIMAVLVIAPSVMAGATGPGVPPMPSVALSQGYTYFNARAITASTALLYSATNLDMGQWPLADVFVTADISGSSSITVTPQYSADNVNWVDSDYTYLANDCTTGTTITVTPSIAASTSVTATADITTSLTSITGGSVITTTGPVTATTSSVCATSLATGDYQLVLSADGSKYVRVPIVGQYLRFKVQNDGIVTFTVKAVMKDGVR